MVFGAWLALHIRASYCLYSIVRAGGIEAETRRSWMIAPRLVQCSKMESYRCRFMK